MAARGVGAALAFLAAAPGLAWRRYRALGLPLAVLASCLLAAVIPFDIAFDRLTFGQPAARAAAMFGVWAAGVWLQRANAFTMPVHGLRRPLLSIALICLATAIWCVGLDTLVFRSTLPAAYAMTESQPLAVRLLYFGARAFNENAIYRLFLGSLLVWVLRLIWRDPSHATLVAFLGMSAGQGLNVYVNVAAGLDHLTLATIAWMALRFFVPGALWGWLYIRHGFVANEAAAIGVHFVLQPLMTVALR